LPEKATQFRKSNKKTRTGYTDSKEVELEKKHQKRNSNNRNNIWKKCGRPHHAGSEPCILRKVGELLAVIKRTPSTRQPSRALNGFGKGWATSTSGLLARLTQRRWVVAFILL
jgi:hypothetical protein